MERDILYLHIPTLPIALARAADPSLRGRPAAVAPAHSERALLQCVSAEARREGLREGMPLSRARRICPSLRVLPPDPARVGQASDLLLRLCAAYSPVVEPAAPGRLFLDLTGSRRLLGPGRDAAMRLDREVAARLDLRGSVGVAGNKLVSRIAAGCLGKPGVCDVLRGSEPGFIGPFPVSVLPGVGEGRQALLLQDLNLRLVEEMAALTVGQLRLVFGPFAPLLHQRARGLDPSPVHPPRRNPEVAEDAWLEREDNDDAVLAAELCRLAEACGLRLRLLGKGASRLTLVVRHADGVQERRAAVLPSPVSGDLALLAAAEGLFAAACHRRVRVKGMRLACGGLGETDRQMDLFAPGDPAARRAEALQEALDRLRTRHGTGIVRWGRSLPR